MSILLFFAPMAFAVADLPPDNAAAFQRGGRVGGASAGGRQVRNTSHTSVNRGGGGNVNRNANVNRNTNLNRNTNVNVNRNVNVHGGYYGGGGCYGCDWDHHDFAAGAAVGVVTGAVIGAAAASNNNNTTVVVTNPGTVVTTLPGGCGAVVVGSISYQRCGSVWYEPRYSGSTVQYVVVNAPM